MRIAWFLGALIADLGAFFSPLALSSSAIALFWLLAIHGSAAALMAFAIHPGLPARFRQPKGYVLMLLFTLAFMAPVVGPLTVALLVRFSLARRGSDSLHAIPQTIALPELDMKSKQADHTAQGAIRSRLAKHVPEHLRMQSLLTLQAVPNPVANPILESLLSDDTDDIRLVAFGMLDTKEKNISLMIQRERADLDMATDDQQRSECLRSLAELHWELIYASLAQGELRQHMLEAALSYAQRAVEIPQAAQDASLALLEGRIQMALGRHEAARTAFERSLHLGQPAASVLPYLAELAFRRHDHAHVRTLMNQLSAHHISPRVRALFDVWTGRDSTKVFHDRRILPHL